LLVSIPAAGIPAADHLIGIKILDFAQTASNMFAFGQEGKWANTGLTRHNTGPAIRYIVAQWRD
jgi:hypothetical protein